MAPHDSGARPSRPDSGDGSTRRGLLRAAGAGVAAVAASTAGCVATLPPLGRRVRYGRVDAPDPDPPSYRRWLPDPSAFQDPPSPDGPDGVVGLQSYTPGNMGGDVVGEDNHLPAKIATTFLDSVGVPHDDLDRVTWFGPAWAVAVDLDRQAVGDTLADTGYEPAGTHRGHDLYHREDIPRALGVGDDGYVFVEGAGGLVDVRAVVDAATGAAPRYHETHEPFRLLSEAAGAAPFTMVGGGDPGDDHLAGALGFTFDADGVYYVRTRVYPPGETPNESALRDELDDGGDGGFLHPRDAREVDVQVDGRTATIAMRRSHEEYREGVPEGERRPPLITWGLDHDRDAATLTIRHEAGERVPADELAVYYGPVVKDGDEPTIDAQFADDHDVVGPGDAVTVDLGDYPEDSPLQTVYVVVSWEAGEPARDVLLRYDPA